MNRTTNYILRGALVLGLVGAAIMGKVYRENYDLAEVGFAHPDYSALGTYNTVKTGGSRITVRAQSWEGIESWELTENEKRIAGGEVEEGKKSRLEKTIHSVHWRPGLRDYELMVVMSNGETVKILTSDATLDVVK